MYELELKLEIEITVLYCLGLLISIEWLELILKNVSYEFLFNHQKNQVIKWEERN